MTEELIIPLFNFDKEQPGKLNLGDSKVIPFEQSSVIIKGPPPKYCLKINSRRDEEPRRTLDRVLIVFKLFKDDVILSECVFIGTKDVDILPHYTHWRDKDRGTPEYVLNKVEEQKFAQFWEEYIEVGPSNFAASRFHLADYQPYSTGRFVSYVESLEYLLVPDSGEGEIAYKFRFRGTILFGSDKSQDERKGLLNDLKDAYSLRSAIVHGATTRRRDRFLGGRSWEEKLKPMRCLSREAIKFFFDKGCLNDNNARKELIEDITIFKTK